MALLQHFNSSLEVMSDRIKVTLPAGVRSKLWKSLRKFESHVLLEGLDETTIHVFPKGGADMETAYHIIAASIYLVLQEHDVWQLCDIDARERGLFVVGLLDRLDIHRQKLQRFDTIWDFSQLTDKQVAILTALPESNKADALEKFRAEYFTKSEAEERFLNSFSLDFRFELLDWVIRGWIGEQADNAARKLLEDVQKIRAKENALASFVHRGAEAIRRARAAGANETALEVLQHTHAGLVLSLESAKKINKELQENLSELSDEVKVFGKVCADLSDSAVMTSALHNWWRRLIQTAADTKTKAEEILSLDDYAVARENWEFIQAHTPPQSAS